MLLGRELATLSARSAAALRRIAVFGPPGGVGDEGRPVLEPRSVAPGPLVGGGDCVGEDWGGWVVSFA